MSASPVPYIRLKDDAYFTPEWCTRVLLRFVEPRGTIWEPAAGDGAIVRPLREAGHRVTLITDINGTRYGCAQADFLRYGSPRDALFSIVTNPPYHLAEAFIRHALDLTSRRCGMVAMLLRVDFDSAGGRTDLFQHQTFARKVILTRRPRWRGPDGDFGNGSPRHNFAWFVWDHRNSRPPVLSYGREDP